MGRKITRLIGSVLILAALLVGLPLALVAQPDLLDRVGLGQTDSTSPSLSTTESDSGLPVAPVPPAEPSPASLPVAADKPERQRLVISGVGDTNLDPNYIPTFRETGYAHAFSGLDEIFIKDDLTVVNFECASSDLGSPAQKSFTFNCAREALPVMTEAGVEVANLANNHAADWGLEALLDTRANVAEAGMSPVGVGANADEAHEAAWFEINGWKIAVLGFGGVIPDPSWVAGENTPGMADGDTIHTMVAAVEAATAQADLVVVTIHWGVELDVEPRAEDIERAHAMIDAGADAIFGHHSHRLQPLEFYQGKPIAWGLGNFVWPRLSDASAASAIAQVVVEPDGSIDACLIPVFIESHGHPVVQGEYQGPCRWT